MGNLATELLARPRGDSRSGEGDVKGWLRDARKPCLPLDPEPLLPEAALQIEHLSSSSQEFLLFLSTRFHSNFLFSPPRSGICPLWGPNQSLGPKSDSPQALLCFMFAFLSHRGWGGPLRRASWRLFSARKDERARGENRGWGTEASVLNLSGGASYRRWEAPQPEGKWITSEESRDVPLS